MFRFGLLVFALLISIELQAAVRLERNYVRFPDTTVNSLAAIETLRFMNIGPRTVNIRIDDFGCFPIFDVDKASCQLPLPPRSICQFNVQMNPRINGLRHCDIRVTDSEGYSDNARLEVLINPK